MRALSTRELVVFAMRELPISMLQMRFEQRQTETGEAKRESVIG
jgi:hypothetical protein